MITETGVYGQRIVGQRYRGVRNMITFGAPAALSAERIFGVIDHLLSRYRR